MGYFMPVSSATQRRLAQVIEKRKADEAEQMRGFGPLGDMPDPPYEQDTPMTPFADTVSGGLMPGLQIQQPGDVRGLPERRAQSDRDWILKPGIRPR